MTKIEGIKEWSDIPVLEDGDILKGGLDGLANVQAKALVDRTEYLKEELQEVKEQTAGLGPNMGGAGEGSGGNLPAGTIIAFGGTTVPVGFLECNGATLSRTTFAGLFAAIGTVWGEPSPTTFKIPNFTEAERFLRSRSETLKVGTVQGDAIRNITGAMGSLVIANHSSYTSGAFYGSGRVNGGGGGTGTAGDYGYSFDASRIVPTATENRPKSAVVMYCIKASDSVVDPELLLAQGVVNDVANKSDRNEVQALAGTRLWVSEEYTPVLNTGTFIGHGLNLTFPEKIKFDVVLIAKTTELSYRVGDVFSNFTTTNASGNDGPLQVRLRSDSISAYTGSALTVRNGLSSAFVTIAPENWRYVFRIWY